MGTDEGNGAHEVEVVALDSLRPHPRNYRIHLDDQVDHVVESIKEHGFYRNIVVARDGTILAGHGVAQAAKKMGLERIPVIRLDVGPDDPRALKVLTGDNEISRLAEVDDRALTELLRDIKVEDVDVGLLGTGFDDQMLAALAMVTRPSSEIEDFDAAAEWAGMPEYEPKEKPLKIIVSFESEADRDSFMSRFYDGERPDGIAEKRGSKIVWSLWWPPKQRDDCASVMFVEEDADVEALAMAMDEEDNGEG